MKIALEKLLKSSTFGTTYNNTFCDFDHLSAKEKIPKLGKGKEDSKEHDTKTCNVPGTPGQGAGENIVSGVLEWFCWIEPGQLGHSFVEGDVLEKFHPGEEDTNSHSALESARPKYLGYEEFN